MRKEEGRNQGRERERAGGGQPFGKEDKPKAFDLITGLHKGSFLCAILPFFLLGQYIYSCTVFINHTFMENSFRFLQPVPEL